MTHVSASAFCVWAVLSTALGAFLLGHLWRFDRFKCLKWSNSPYSGSFKRIMTYTYLITIPLIMIYSFGFTYIKYKEGFIDIAGTIVTKPYNFWDERYQRVIFPLMMVFSFAWSFEMITHLEELCFWLFLLNAGPQQPDWFRSPFFRLWMAGSFVAVRLLCPSVTIAYRGDPLSCEAHTFLAGSVGDLVLTTAFIPILLSFPNFLRKVKAEGVDPSIVIRLRKFYELNVVRIIFRFLMHIPLLALGADGVQAHKHELNESMFWTDLFSIVAGLGCVFSSVCTLLIFFPRSYEAEYQANEASQHRSNHTRSSLQTSRPGAQESSSAGRSQALTMTVVDSLEGRRMRPTARAGTVPAPTSGAGLARLARAESEAETTKDATGTYLLTDSPVLRAEALARAKPGGGLARVRAHLADAPAYCTEGDPWADAKAAEDGGVRALPEMAYETPPHTPRHLGFALGLATGAGTLTAANVQRHNVRQSQINPLVHSFTSPIDLLERRETPHPGTPRRSQSGWGV
ncbi:hypothetical protein DFH11DRAFT_1730338 [Phellopilus nigrolimitatus]|nr:hypothetical protein DFH11DRAFT_1730338 [Phellopilus nigrolimitatus]